MPSGNLINCNRLLIEPLLYMSSNSGSSTDGSIWLTRTSFLLAAMATLRASTDLALPTNNVVTIPGNTTTSLRGINGRSDFISFITPI